MTGPEFTAALASIGWSKRQLIGRIRCDTHLPIQWARGDVAVPPKIAAWLTKLCACHARHPAPTKWRQ